MTLPFFQQVPGFGAPSDGPEQRPHLAFDRNGILLVKLGCHADTRAGWASSSNRCRIVSVSNCVTYYDSDLHRDIFTKTEDGKVTHYLRLRRTDATNFPEGWTNAVIDFAGDTRIERLFTTACTCP